MRHSPDAILVDARSSSSLLQAVKQPLRADDLAPQFFNASAKRSIRRYQDQLTLRLSNEANKHFIAVRGRMEHGHSVGDTSFDAAPGRSFESGH